MGESSQAIPFPGDRRERGAGKEKVLGLENKRGVPHRHQPLHSILPTAEPVLIHSRDDMQHFPMPEAQLVRSCSIVVTESSDCPVGLRCAGCRDLKFLRRRGSLGRCPPLHQSQHTHCRGQPAGWSPGLWGSTLSFCEAPRHSEQSPQPYASVWCSFLCGQGPLLCDLSCSPVMPRSPSGKREALGAARGVDPGSLGQLLPPAAWGRRA